VLDASARVFVNHGGLLLNANVNIKVGPLGEQESGLEVSLLTSELQQGDSRRLHGCCSIKECHQRSLEVAGAAIVCDSGSEFRDSTLDGTVRELCEVLFHQAELIDTHKAHVVRSRVEAEEQKRSRYDGIISADSNLITNATSDLKAS
jgi:hypothetical protein